MDLRWVWPWALLWQDTSRGKRIFQEIQLSWHNRCCGAVMHPWITDGSVSREEGRWLRRWFDIAHPWRCGGGCRLGTCIWGHTWRCLWDDMGGKICIVVDGGLLEDIFEVAEGLDGGFAHVGGHLIVSCSCKHPCCRNNPVFRSDRRIWQIFVFEESCARDAGCARGYQPELQTPIVFV